MIKIEELDHQHTYSVLLCDGGAIIGTLIFPTDGTSRTSLGGFPITHPRSSPTIRKGNLCFFTLDVGIGVYEVLLPLEQICGLYQLGLIDEPIITSPRQALWRELGPQQTWRIPFGRLLVDKSIELIKDRKLRFRPVVEKPMARSFPHPVSFPRYAPFRPKHSVVVYLDHDVMSSFFLHFEHEKALLQIFKSRSALSLREVSKSEVGKLLFTKGAIGFFDPPQIVTWMGQPAELVAITSKPFSEGELGEDWILGCVRATCFPFFRESVERLDCTYYMCGEWREMGVFETEYGGRRNVLLLGAGFYFDKDTELGTESKPSFKMGEVRDWSYLTKGTPKHQNVSPKTQERVDPGTGEVDLFKSKQDKVIRILFLAANPTDSTRLRLDEECRAIDQALRKAEFRDKFDIRQHWAVRVSDIQELLLRHKPDIVHFSGHGSKSSEIILEDRSGKMHPVSTRALSRLFSVLKDDIRCVVLNACYSKQQGQAIAEHIDCVIGMSKAISDSSAISFATAFYQALGYGKDVKTAFDLGCIQIDLENLGEQDMPKLLALKSKAEEIVFAKNS